MNLVIAVLVLLPCMHHLLTSLLLRSRLLPFSGWRVSRVTSVLVELRRTWRGGARGTCS